MRLSLFAVGRLKDGPERALVSRYQERIAPLGRSVGFSRFDMVEVPESPARRAQERISAEGTALLSKTEGAAVALFDERGTSCSSQTFAAWIASQRDAGVAWLAFGIGGADGLDETTKARSTRLFSFGAMTLPHQIVRVLAMEQIYRAMTILTGHPYHREG